MKLFYFLSIFFFPLNLHFEEDPDCCILLRGAGGWTDRGDATISAHQVTPHQQSYLDAELFSISSPIFSQSQGSLGGWELSDAGQQIPVQELHSHRVGAAARHC